MLAAASDHEVWVLTLPESIPALSRVLDEDPRAASIHLKSTPFGSQRVVEDLTSWAVPPAID